MATLCNCDKLRTVKIECFDWDSDGSHDLIGACEFNVENMLGKKDFPLDLINPKKKAKKKRYKNSTFSLPLLVRTPDAQQDLPAKQVAGVAVHEARHRKGVRARLA